MINCQVSEGHFDDEGFCRCGAACCVDEGSGECRCSRCACQRNEKIDFTPRNSYLYDGAYRQAYELGADLLAMGVQRALDEDRNLASMARGEFVD